MTTESSSPPSSAAPPGAPPTVAAPGLLLQAVREATAGAYELLGALGAEEDVPLAYLARETSSGELLVLRLDREAGGEGGSDTFQLVELRALDASVPVDEDPCPSCNAPVNAWRRRCPACGTDVSGVERDAGPGTSRGELMRHVRTLAEGRFEILGDIPRAEGGGAVYFARELPSQALVALRLLPAEGDGGTDGGAYTLGVTQLIHPRHAVTAVQPPRPSAAKVCPQCGLEFGEEEKFCPNDGVALRSVAASRGLIGQILADRYQIVRKLGEGGMGEVYLGEHVKMGRACAIKVMRNALVNDADAAGRFAREAANASRINHPSVAVVYDFGETSDGIVYLAMEYIEGEPLSAVLAREGRLDPERVARIGRDVADALAAAHELGIVHRDLKPDNIMIAAGKDGRDVVKVVDFGIAKAMHGGRQSITRTGYVLGTPAYMSPEQITGDTLDGRSDIYSLGCILYELLTGQPTFASASGEGIINRRLTEPAPHPRKVNEAIPRALDDVVWKALARSPAERYQSATELAEALSAPLSGGTGGLVSRLPFFAKRRAPAPPVTRRTAASADRGAPRPSVIPTVRAPRPSSGATLVPPPSAPQSPAVPSPRRQSAAAPGSAAGRAGAPAATRTRAPERARARSAVRRVLPAAAVVVVVGTGIGIAAARRRAARTTTAPGAAANAAQRDTTAAAPSTPPQPAAAPAGAIAIDTLSQPAPDTTGGFDRLLNFDEILASTARKRAVTAGVGRAELSRGDSLIEASRAHRKQNENLAAYRALGAARKYWDDAAKEAIAAKTRAASAAAAVAAGTGGAPVTPAATAPGATKSAAGAGAAGAPTVTPAPTTGGGEASRPVAPTPTPPSPSGAAPAPAASDAQAQAALAKDVLTRYVAALGAGKVDAMHSLYPGMPDQEQSSYRTLFQRANDVSTALSGEPVVNVSGSTATADFSYVFSYFYPGLGNQRRPFHWHATLSRGADGSWHIDRLEAVK